MFHKIPVGRELMAFEENAFGEWIGADNIMISAPTITRQFSANVREALLTSGVAEGLLLQEWKQDLRSGVGESSSDRGLLQLNRRSVPLHDYRGVS